MDRQIDIQRYIDTFKNYISIDRQKGKRQKEKKIDSKIDRYNELTIYCT